MGFKKELAKKSTLETFNDGAPVDSQGVDIKSPGKMHWFTIKGTTYEDITEVITTKLYDPDGEILEYIIQVEEKSIREKVINKADDNVNVKALCRCVNWYGTEFLWLPAVQSRGNSKVASQSARKAIDLGLNNNWIKCQWKDGRNGWTAWSHPGTDKIPQWSNMTDEEVIDLVFDNRIIETLYHEELERNVGKSV